MELCINVLSPNGIKQAFTVSHYQDVFTRIINITCRNAKSLKALYVGASLATDNFIQKLLVAVNKYDES
jgi:hypothetical protein